MLYCTRCGTPIPDGANFCMRCGAPAARVETPQPAQGFSMAAPAAIPAAPYAAPVQKKPFRALPFIVLVAAILGVLLFGLAASGALNKTAGPTGEALRLQGKAPSPALIQTAKAAATMPPEIRDWLEHLRRIEERKNKLNAQEVAQLKVFTAKFEALGPAAGLLSGSGDDEDNTNPEVPVQQQITDLSAPWKQLIKDFQAVPPPPECQRLADEYFAGLNEIPGMMGDIQGIVDSVSQSASGTAPTTSGAPDAKDALDKAYTIQGTSGDSIDVHFTTSDQLLGRICDQYNTQKWFNITPDIGGSALGKTPF